MAQPMTLAEVASKFSDEASAWEYVEKLRWDGRPECPRCGSENVRFVVPNAQRLTRTGTKTFRRVWMCRSCRKQFSVLIGTIFEGTKIPLSKWLMGIYLMSASKNGIAALELQRNLGITYKSAWFMVHRIRMALANTGNPMMSGTIIADETFVGGSTTNMHKSKLEKPVRIGSGKRTGVGPFKTPVVTVINPDTETARSTVVNDISGATLRKTLAENVDFGASTLVTDEALAYKTFSHEMVAHETVNHRKGQYVHNGFTTNKVEGHFSQLKRAIDGTHHGVSAEHLQRYAREFDYRYGTRRLSDGERATKVIAQARNTSISYRTLISTGPVAMGTWPKPVGRPGSR